MSMTPVPISIRLVRAPTAARSGNGEASCRAKWWTRKYAPSAPSSSAATASSIDWSRASDAERTCEYGESDQWPNDRNPMRFIERRVSRQRPAGAPLAVAGPSACVRLATLAVADPHRGRTSPQARLAAARPLRRRPDSGSYHICDTVAHVPRYLRLLLSVDFEEHQARTGRPVVTFREAQQVWDNGFLPRRNRRGDTNTRLLIGATDGRRRVTIVARHLGDGDWLAWTAWDTKPSDLA